jgi:hypothetical protein
MTVVYDVETLASCYTYTAINVKTDEVYQYVLHEELFQLELLATHLKYCQGQIGFNNVNFDYPIIHYILNNHYTWWNNLQMGYITEKEIISLIYNKAQEIINSQDTDDFYKNIYVPEKKWKIHQLDLFRMWHYNNKARKTSLKALEISMNYPNVMEMEISHTKEDITLDEVTHILEYNLNDVLATYEFYKRSKDKIDLRKELTKTYNIPCLNWSDSKIGEQLILKLYCDKTELNQWDVRELRTYRPKIDFKDIIFDYIRFDSTEFNKLLNKLKSTTISKTKGGFAESVIYKEFKYDLGQGGIHGCIKPGIYESDEDYIILDADVASLYPNIAIKNNLYIRHLGKDFITTYDNDIVQKRLKAKKEGNKSIADALKLSANSVYGKSNDVNSFLYDPLYTMATTINGQLLLLMLAEDLVDRIRDLTVLQINTDGITVKIPKSNYSQNAYYNICKDWESKTNLELEYAEYSKMVIRDVNSYLAVYTNGKVKYKGAFEIDKDYHKDNSFRVIQIALSNYFVKGISVEDTITNHRDIYDFCGRQKFTKDSYGETHEVRYNKDNNPYHYIEKQQRNVRYYISNSKTTFVKQYYKNSSELINKGFNVTIFNKFEEKEWNDYNLDYSYYIKECYKIIETIENKQLSLFN